MHDGRTGILVLGLGDPHGLEGSESGKDRSSNPHRVLTLGRSDDLDAHGRRGKSGDLLGETLCNTLEHSRTSGAHNVGVQVLSDINITSHDRIERGLVNTCVCVIIFVFLYIYVYVIEKIHHIKQRCL